MTPLLSIRDLTIDFRTDRQSFRALDGLSLDVAPGRTLALVGESGSGKSVTAQAILRILPQIGRDHRGRILFRNRTGRAPPTSPPCRPTARGCATCAAAASR